MILRTIEKKNPIAIAERRAAHFHRTYTVVFVLTNHTTDTASRASVVDIARNTSYVNSFSKSKGVVSLSGLSRAKAWVNERSALDYARTILESTGQAYSVVQVDSDLVSLDNVSDYYYYGG